MFLTITALMLAAAWYLTYRHPKADHCSAEGCPQNPVAKWNKVILRLATAFVIAIAAFPIYSGVAARLLIPAGASDSGASQMKLAPLQVNIPSMDLDPNVQGRCNFAGLLERAGRRSSFAGRSAA